VESQRNPREANWTPGQTAPSDFNLEVKGANHFSQANHPEMRKQLNTVFDGRFTTNPQIQEAFRVN
jgi:preprotein translocase subunit SecD